VAASRAGLDLLLDVGTATVERHVLELSGRCVDGLLERGLHVYTQPEPEFRAGVVALPVIDGKPIVAFLRERAVDVWTDPSATLLRVDPHVFNDVSDLERFFDGLDEFRQTHGTTSL
jgi:selenocysteine lyase/cysteine desulfurase